MKVVATQLGYYGLRRIKPGNVFVLKDPKHFSPKWMEEVKKKPVTVEPVDQGEDEEEEFESEAPKKQSKPRGRAKPKPEAQGEPEGESKPTGENEVI